MAATTPILRPSSLSHCQDGLAILNLCHLPGTTFTRSCVASLRVSSNPFEVEYTSQSKLRDWLLEENRHLTDPEEINKAIKMGEYIRNGTSYHLSS